MSRLTWNAVGQRFYEAGVDRGVLYVGLNPGVPWTGLISVSEAPNGGDPRPYYQDGVKYLNLSSAEEFEATINAFSSPPEFAPCDGVMSVQNGLFATQQPRKPFGLSYRTMIGNDIVGKKYGYKIHLVYNALAGPSGRNNASLGADVEPNSYTWQITTLPPVLTGIKPTAHFVVDSRITSPTVLKALEDILYGNDDLEASLPTAAELFELFTVTYPPMKAIMVAPNVYQFFEVDSIDARTIVQASPPDSPAVGEEPILWLDTSNGSYAIPKLVTGA